MRPQENYTPFVAVALVLSLAILVLFQIYILREPARVAADEAREKSAALAAGRTLYAENCAMCHGAEGEGVDAPPLNDKDLLADTPDRTLFSLINSGVPGTEMPAWNQVHGGPFTDEQVRQMVAFIRSWEADAPDRRAQALAGDPVEGLVIFNSACIVCHGEEGRGSERAPALNDPARLAQLDDEWYADAIAQGRLARGMPTWGTVLSPQQIRDIVALLRAWARGEVVEPPGAEEALAEAVHQFGHGDLHAARHELEKAAQSAGGEVLAAINDALAAIEAGDKAAVEAALGRAQDLMGVESDGHEEASGPGEMSAGSLHLLMALAAVESGDSADAVHHVEHEMGAGHDEHGERMEAIHQLLNAGETAEAEHLLAEMLSVPRAEDQDVKQLHLKLAAQAISNHDDPEIEHHLNHFIELASGIDKIKAREVLDLLATGDMHEAGHIVEELMGITPHED